MANRSFGKAWNAIYWLNLINPWLPITATMKGLYTTEVQKLGSRPLFCMGTPLFYNGEEIGMTNPHFKSIADFKMSLSPNIILISKMELILRLTLLMRRYPPEIMPGR